MYHNLENYIANKNLPLSEGYWKLKKQEAFLNNILLVVLDDDERFIGAMTYSDFTKQLHLDGGTVGEFCNKKAKHVPHSENSRSQAALIFVENPHIHALPELDEEMRLVDIIFRHQVCYKEFYIKELLPRMYYARQIFGAAELAHYLGYPAISVIEFGVGGGSGLVNCEFHAKEISRLFNIHIDVYGFDTATGLPPPNDYRDIPYIFRDGYYRMDVRKLQNRLRFAKLILGDIKETFNDFIAKEDFAPIGAMMVDVDYYSSTVPILQSLLGDPGSFMPRVKIYFDDIWPGIEHLGESLAISEFNQSGKNVTLARSSAQAVCNEYDAHLYLHKDYDITVHKIDRQLPLV